MLNKLHPNSRTAWMLVALTVMMSAGMVALLHLASNSAEGRILFTQFDGQDYEIFAMDLDGNIEQLTDNDVDDWAAGWSPDYSQIAFRSDRDGMTRVYVMDADGSNVRDVSPDFLYAGEWGRAGIPSWSPDGQSLAFEAINLNEPVQDFDIFVVNLRSGALDQVTDYAGNEWHPDYSPDGTRIAFAHDGPSLDCYNDCDIYVMNADGTHVKQYTNTPGMDVFPQWSPNGYHIMFHSERSGNSDIFVMGADGSHQINLTNSPTLERVARWSNDGQSIIFRSERDGDSDIFVMSLCNGATTAITENDIADHYPDW
ncbi:MAG: DPP IV N-terminal domain-containing protein [Anaerolineae bacterium]